MKQYNIFKQYILLNNTIQERYSELTKLRFDYKIFQKERLVLIDIIKDFYKIPWNMHSVTDKLDIYDLRKKLDIIRKDITDIGLSIRKLKNNIKYLLKVKETLNKLTKDFDNSIIEFMRSVSLAKPDVYKVSFETDQHLVFF